MLFLQQPEPLAVIEKCAYNSEAIYIALLHAKDQLYCESQLW